MGINAAAACQARWFFDQTRLRPLWVWNLKMRSYLCFVSKKSVKVATLIEKCHGRDLPAHYLGFFECFNQELFFESHDVLEELWLPNRHGPNGNFYRALIQLAGGFVHLQKDRLRSAASLFKLAQKNLRAYPAVHEHLDLEEVLDLIAQWLGYLDRTGFKENPLSSKPAPKLRLLTR